MRLLLDSNILLWWMAADRRLPKRLAAALASSENDVAVSAASIWEIAIKRTLGRLDVDLDELLAAVAADGFSELPVRFASGRGWRNEATAAVRAGSRFPMSSSHGIRSDQTARAAWSCR